MPKQYVIIGAAAAGVGALNKLRQLEADAAIICIASERELPYNKCVLTDYCLAEKTREQITIFTQQMAEQKNIQLLLGVRVIAINREEKTVLCDNGNTYRYDALLIATGARPVIPPIDGTTAVHHLFHFYNLADADRLLKFVQEKKPQTALVIGAGLSGLECADVLHYHGLQVTIVERQSHILPGQVNAVEAQVLTDAIAAQDVQIKTGAQVVSIMQAGDQLQVAFADDTKQTVDLIVLAVGVCPNVELAVHADLQIHELGGIAVDAQMRTGDVHIFAAGDVVCVPNAFDGTMMRSCMWPDAMQQGMIAASNMAGQHKAYSGAVPVISSTFFGIKFSSAGAVQLQEGWRECSQKKPDAYCRLILSGRQLKGFVLIGDIKQATWLRRALLTQELLGEEQLALLI